MSKNKRASLDDDEFNEAEADGWDEDLIRVEGGDRPADAPQTGSGHRRDWRDAEKYREQRELRRQIDDSYWFDDLKVTSRRSRPRR